MKKPNLLYIFADQWRNHAIGFQKEDPVKTPHMDRFAGESMVMTNAISTYPLCSPHRAALLTGKFPYSCGMWTNCKIGLDEVLMLKPQEVTIGNVLKEEGYQTGYIGKWHLDAAEMNFNDAPQSGAKGWGAYTPPGERRQGFDYWLSYGAMNEHMYPYYWGDTDEKITPGYWSVAYETDMAMKYMSSREDDKPFALFISYNPPHSPYDQVPEKYKEIYDDVDIPFRPNVPDDLRAEKDITMIKDYYAAVSGIDEHFGRLLKFLDDNGLTEDTLVVLSSDHGDMLNSHRYNGKNVWYEESINIPMLIKYPQKIKHGECEELIGSQDHMPTILDLMNIDIPDSCQGISLAGNIQGESEEKQDYGFICMIPGLPELIEPYAKKGLNHKCFGWRGIRSKTHTYVVYNGIEPGEKQRRLLFDNEKDPYQMHPVQINAFGEHLEAGKSFGNPYVIHMDTDVKHNELVIELEEQLRQYLALTNDPFLLRV